MPKKRKSFKEALAEFMESYDEDSDGDEDDDDVITLRGPSARRLLGLMEDDHAASGGGDKDDGNGDGGKPDPEPETAPQRGQSRYFGSGS